MRVKSATTDSNSRVESSLILFSLYSSFSYYACVCPLHPSVQYGHGLSFSASGFRVHPLQA